MLFNMDRVILSLCDHSGAWSAPYRSAGYTVRTVDVSHGADVRLLEYPGQVWGILAAPPCDRFCNPSARLRPTSDALTTATSPVTVSGTTDSWQTSYLLDRLAIADACLRLVALCRPRWWVLENAVGRLPRWYGPPALRFDPCDYAGWADDPQGDAYTKRTCLWGNFTSPTLRRVEPEPYPAHLPPGRRDRTSRVSSSWKRQRAQTPQGFARAFFAANH